MEVRLIEDPSEGNYGVEVRIGRDEVVENIDKLSFIEEIQTAVAGKIADAIFEELKPLLNCGSLHKAIEMVTATEYGVTNDE